MLASLRALAVASLALALSPVVHGNDPAPFSPHHDNRILWPAQLEPSGDFGRAVIGRFHEQRWTSAVVMRGPAAFALIAPDVFTAIVPVDDGSGQLRDVAVLADGVATGIDALVGVGDLGLFRYDLDEPSQTFLRTPLGSAEWVGARRVIGADVDGAFGTDVVGIAQDGMELLVLASDGSGGWTEDSVQVPYEALDVAVLDHFAGGAKEFVVLTVDGLYFLDAGDGSCVGDVRTAHPGGAVVTCRSEGETPAERVAWSVFVAEETHQILHHFDSLVMDAPVHCVLPPVPGAPAVELDLVGLASGDWDGDGLQDLVLPHRSYHRATILLNQGDAQNFSAGEEGIDYLQIDLATDAELAAPENGSVFAFGELGSPDRDGIVAPQDSTQTIAVLREPSPLEVATTSVTTQEASGSSGFFAAKSLYDYDAGTDIGVLRLFLDDVPQALRTGYTHIQVVEWSQPDPTATETDADPNAKRNDLYTVEDPGCSQMSLAIAFDHALYDYDDIYWEDRRHAWLQMRFVNLVQGTTDVLDASHSILLGMTLEPQPTTGLAYLDYLLGREGSGGRVALEVPTIQFPHVGDAEVGSLVVQEFLPPFPAGQPPTVPQGDDDGFSAESLCE